MSNPTQRPKWCNLHRYQRPTTYSNEETPSTVITFNTSTQQFKKWRLTGVRY